VTLEETWHPWPPQKTTTAAAATTNETVTHKILQATIESADVDHFGGTTQSRIIIYARLDHKSLKPLLDKLVNQGMLTKQCITHDNPHHAKCTWDKTRSKRAPYKTVYKVTPLGYDWLIHHCQEQQQQQKKPTTTE
jgi:hypothetical protein